MRAMAVAILFLFANLIGMGIGPLITGVLSDAFRSWSGDASLGYALVTMSPGYLWGAWHLWQASRTVAGDLPRGAGGGREDESGRTDYTEHATTAAKIALSKE
jgi:MFS family permease